MTEASSSGRGDAAELEAESTVAGGDAQLGPVQSAKTVVRSGVAKLQQTSLQLQVECSLE